MQAAEIELKFPVSDADAFRRSLPSDLFQLETERTFESNTLYDTPDRQLRTRKELLRIRHYGERCTLTHKRMPTGSDENGQRYKTRIETETLVSDGDALADVFTHLGYGPVFRYEKFRTEWGSPDGGHLVLDETPIGTWAELEGSTAWIDAMLQQLNVSVADTITLSYGTLFLDWRKKTGSSAETLTFDEINQLIAQ